jgi:hypothetical protein
MFSRENPEFEAWAAIIRCDIRVCFDCLIDLFKDNSITAGDGLLPED